MPFQSPLISCFASPSPHSSCSTLSTWSPQLPRVWSCWLSPSALPQSCRRWSGRLPRWTPVSSWKTPLACVTSPSSWWRCRRSAPRSSYPRLACLLTSCTKRWGKGYLLEDFRDAFVVIFISFIYFWNVNLIIPDMYVIFGRNAF